MTRRNLLQAAVVTAAAPAIRAQRRPANAGPSILYADSHAVVETASGKVRGYSEDGIFTFKGMPYGATTAGAARFQPPKPPAPWSGVRDHLRYGPVCPDLPRRWNALPDYFAFPPGVRLRCRR